MSYEVNKYGFDFDGASYTKSNNSFGLTSFSWCGWVNAYNSTGRIAIKRNVNDNTDYNFIIDVATGSVVRFSMRDGNANNTSYGLTNIVANDKFYHIALTYDSASNTVILYVDGIIDKSATISSPIPTPTASKMILGYDENYVAVGFFTGKMYDVKIFDSALNQTQIQTEMTNDNITTVGHWTLNQTLDDSSPNGNDATVTGVEQYALISTETVYGTKCTKTETFEQDANDTFDELIYDWFYGGTIKIEVDNLAWKTIKILAYDDESNSYLPIKVETTTLREHAIVIPKTATRRLKLSIDSDSTFTTVVYTLESVFDVINDTDSNSSGAVAIDYNVIYSDVNIEKRSMSFRVNDSDAHFAQSILQNKVYLDNEIHQITSLQVSELDVNRKEFKCDFLRLLNE